MEHLLYIFKSYVSATIGAPQPESCKAEPLMRALTTFCLGRGDKGWAWRAGLIRRSFIQSLNKHRLFTLLLWAEPCDFTFSHCLLMTLVCS